jgi:casein kinase II subunit beta
VAPKREYDLLAELSETATATSASFDERRLSYALEKSLTIDEIALNDHFTMSSSSQAPESWISAFCSLVGHEYFAEVSEDFIEDDFNLTGLQSQVPMYKEALEMILDVEPEDASDEEDDEEDDDDDDEDEMLDAEGRAYKRADAAERRHLRMASDLSVIESSAEMLYGLIHQRFITSRQGIQQMAEKYELGHFGHCPRVHCYGARVLPVGCSDIPGQETVKLFCPSCLDVYTPPNSRFQTVDGAFFGTTFGCLFFMTFPELDVGGDKPAPPAATPLSDPLSIGPSSSTGGTGASGTKTARSSLSSSLTSGQPPAPPHNTSSSATANANPTPLPPQPENINGVTPRNLAPGLGFGSFYEPRIYGFRVSEVAKTGPRMKWLRSKPADANELDESALWAAQQAAKSAAAAAPSLADADMPDQSQEVGGEVEDEDMEGAEGGVVGEVISGKAGKSARRANGDGVAGEAGGTAVRAGAGGG